MCQMTSVISEIFLLDFRAAYKLRVAGYISKHALQLHFGKTFHAHFKYESKPFVATTPTTHQTTLLHQRILHSMLKAAKTIYNPILFLLFCTNKCPVDSPVYIQGNFHIVISIHAGKFPTLVNVQNILTVVPLSL